MYVVFLFFGVLKVFGLFVWFVYMLGIWLFKVIG